MSLHWGHDEDILYACADHNLLIPWDVAMTPGQSVTKIEWFFQGANSTIKIASLTNGSRCEAKLLLIGCRYYSKLV